MGVPWGVMGMPWGCHGSGGALDVSCGCHAGVFSLSIGALRVSWVCTHGGVMRGPMECFGSDMECLGLPWRWHGGYFGVSLGLIGVIWMPWMPHGGPWES